MIWVQSTASMFDSKEKKKKRVKCFVRINTKRFQGEEKFRTQTISNQFQHFKKKEGETKLKSTAKIYLIQVAKTYDKDCNLKSPTYDKD